jgi:replication factor A1
MIVLKVAVVQRDSAAVGSPTDVSGAPGGAAQAPAAATPQYQQQQQQQQQYAAPPPLQQQYAPPPQQYAPAPSYGGAPAAPPSYGGGGGGGGAIAKAELGGTFQPIDSLNPYQNRWTIKARITSKGEMKSWNNARGSGTLFKIELLDDRGGEIAACFFKESADKFYPLLEVNQVYTFANGRLKVANKQYSSCSSDYEISFGNDADIRLCAQVSSPPS